MGGYAAVSSGRVMECVRQLAAGGQPATREAVARLSGLKKAIVDDRLRTLVDAEQLRRTSRGVYVLVETYAPPRKMSKTILSDGYVEIVVGDEVLMLTPEEDRNLAMLQAGAATAVVAAGVAQQQQQALGELVGQTTATQRDVRLFSRQLASAATMMKNEVASMRRALAGKGESEARVKAQSGVQLALCLRPKVEKRKDRKHGEGNSEGGNTSEAFGGKADSKEFGKADGKADAPEGAAAGSACAEKDAGKGAGKNTVSKAARNSGQNPRRKTRRQKRRQETGTDAKANAPRGAAPRARQS